MSFAPSSGEPAAPVTAPTSAAAHRTLSTMVLSLAERGGRPALRFRSDGAIVQWSYAQLHRRVKQLARGLIGVGVQPGDRVAVLANTSPEWTVVDCAILAAGAVVVPIYHTNSPEECAHVLEHSGARAVFCEDAGQLEKVRAIRDRCPSLKHVVGVRDAGPGEASLDDLARRAREVGPDRLAERAAAIAPADVATIVYTSGTTGPPKGCLLTHANLIATMDMYEQRLELGGSAVVFLFLPLAHVLARVTQMVVLDVGGVLAYWRGSSATVLEDIEAARPTHVPAVPRVFEKIRTRALATAGESGPKRRLFDWALATGARLREAERSGGAGAFLRARAAVADRLVLSKVRGLFGGDLELALTGAAPIAADVLGFFDACGVLVLEGYGMTETCAAGTLNSPDAFRFGTVGRPLAGTEVAIAEDGELLVRGPSIFAGYHRDPGATAEVLEAGWLHTGDLGSVDDDGFVRITGRKKDIIITSSGKNITPSNIEAALRESRWISEAVVAGDDRPYLVALLTLDADEAPALAAELGVEADLSAMARDERVRAALQAEVDAVNTRFARIEQVKRFTVLDHELSQGSGELTPTLKVKRQVVSLRYADEIAALYG
jgi:long-chain acyl-CoA synthetase